MVYNHHCLMRRKSQGDYRCMMAVDVDGHVEPDRVRGALALAMAAHPATMAGLGVDLVWGRPYWRLPRPIDAAASQAAAAAHRFVDLSKQPDCPGCLERSVRTSLAASWDYAAGPQLRLDQYALADGRTRFCLRWPHFLTDAEGAQGFLYDLGRFDQAASGEPFSSPSIDRADAAGREPIDVLAPYSTAQRIRLFRRALAAMREPPAGRLISLFPQRFPPATSHGLLHRCWDAASVSRLHAAAKSTTPAGPGLYARHLIACVIRGLHRIYVEHNVDTDAYAITLPVRVAPPVSSETTRSGRPVHGNYLVPLTISGRRDLITDMQALGEDILRQHRRFLDGRMDLHWCSVMWALSHLRLSMYQALLKLDLGYVPLAAGFSYYGEIDPPIRSLGGKNVTNVWGSSLVATPPGWNVAFSRFRDSLNLALTYACPAVAGEMAVRFLDYIEAEMFTAT